MLGVVIIDGWKVFLLFLVKIMLRESLIVVQDALIFLSALYFASIAFLPKGKIEIVAVIANPVALSSSQMRLGLVLNAGDVFFERS